MGKFTYEDQGNNTFLVYEVGKDEVLDTLSAGMLTHNKINGLTSTLITQMDETKYIKYNITSKIPVKQTFEGPVNKKRLIGIFKGIVTAMLSAEEYMIDFQSLLIDTQYIFSDTATCETEMVCLPIISTETKETDARAFFRNLMFSIQFDPTENCDHVTKILNYLNSVPGFSAAAFKEVLDHIDTNAAKPATDHKNPLEHKEEIKAGQVPSAVPTQQPFVSPQKPGGFVQQPAVPVQQPAVPVQQPAAPVQRPAAPVQRPAAPVQQPPMNMPPIPAAGKQKAAKKPWLFGKQSGEDKTGKDKRGKAMQKAAPQYPNAAGQMYGFAVPGQADPRLAAPSPAAAAQPAQPKKAPVQPNVTPSVFTQQAQPPQTQKVDFGNTIVLNMKNSGETTVLGVQPGSAQPQPYLVRKKNNEKVFVNKPVFRIGKEKSYVDYFISDNTAISRSHANIVSRDGEYFIVDTNSTNHTYVNGGMLQSNVETKLSHDTKIRLANEDFEFKLY